MGHRCAITGTCGDGAGPAPTPTTDGMGDHRRGPRRRRDRGGPGVGPVPPVVTSPVVTTAGAGLRTHSFHGLAVDVPSSWSTGATRCGIPTENTVVLTDGTFEACGLATAPAVSAVYFVRFDPRYVPRIPPTCCSASDPTGSAPVDRGRHTVISGITATQRTSRPAGDDVFFTETFTVESQRVAVIIRSPDQQTVDAVVATLRMVQSDTNGCASRTDEVDVLPTELREPVRNGAAAELIPGGPVTVTVCRYVGGWLEASRRLAAGPEVAALVRPLNATASGTSHAGETKQACMPNTPSGTAEDSPATRDGYRIQADYTDGPPIVVIARINGCGDLGASNGSRTNQMTFELAGAIAGAAGSGSFPATFSPNA